MRRNASYRRGSLVICLVPIDFYVGTPFLLILSLCRAFIISDKTNAEKVVFLPLLAYALALLHFPAVTIIPLPSV